MNKNLKEKLKQQNKSISSLASVLVISPQSAHSLVNNMDLSKSYNRLKKIADYLECDIEDIID